MHTLDLGFSGARFQSPRQRRERERRQGDRKPRQRDVEPGEAGQRAAGRGGDVAARGASPTTAATYHGVLGRKCLTKNKIPFDAAMTLH